MAKATLETKSRSSFKHRDHDCYPGLAQRGEQPSRPSSPEKKMRSSSHRISSISSHRRLQIPSPYATQRNARTQGNQKEKKSGEREGTGG